MERFHTLYLMYNKITRSIFTKNADLQKKACNLQKYKLSLAYYDKNGEIRHPWEIPRDASVEQVKHPL